MQVNFQLNFSTKFTRKIKSILKLAMLRMFCQPETESPTPACKTCRSHFNLFFEQNLLGNQKYFEHAMQVNFQLILSSKFTGRIKIILKLALLHWFCEPEPGGPPLQHAKHTGHILFDFWYYCGLCPHHQIFCNMMFIFDDLHLYMIWSSVNGVRILL